jgi:hypothetical protein
MPTVLMLAGGAGFSGSIESVAELRVHTQAIRGLKPLPQWLFAVIDNLDAQEQEFPGKYMANSTSKLGFFDGSGVQ